MDLNDCVQDTAHSQNFAVVSMLLSVFSTILVLLPLANVGTCLGGALLARFCLADFGTVLGSELLVLQPLELLIPSEEFNDRLLRKVDPSRGDPHTHPSASSLFSIGSFTTSQDVGSPRRRRCIGPPRSSSGGGSAVVVALRWHTTYVVGEVVIFQYKGGLFYE